MDCIYSLSQESHRLHDQISLLWIAPLSFKTAPTRTTRICGWASCFLRLSVAPLFLHRPVQAESVGLWVEDWTGVLTALVAELMLILSRWPPVPPVLERPKHALKGGCTRYFSTERIMESQFMLQYLEFPGVYGELCIPGIFQSCKMLTFIWRRVTCEAKGNMPKVEFEIPLTATLEQSVHPRRVSSEEAKSLLC